MKDREVYEQRTQAEVENTRKILRSYIGSRYSKPALANQLRDRAKRLFEARNLPISDEGKTQAVKIATYASGLPGVL